MVPTDFDERILLNSQNSIVPFLLSSISSINFSAILLVDRRPRSLRAFVNSFESIVPDPSVSILLKTCRARVNCSFVIGIVLIGFWLLAASGLCAADDLGISLEVASSGFDSLSSGPGGWSDLSLKSRA